MVWLDEQRYKRQVINIARMKHKTVEKRSFMFGGPKGEVADSNRKPREERGVSYPIIIITYERCKRGSLLIISMYSVSKDVYAQTSEDTCFTRLSKRWRFESGRGQIVVGL